jgi:hypothetical protein
LVLLWTTCIWGEKSSMNNGLVSSDGLVLTASPKWEWMVFIIASSICRHLKSNPLGKCEFLCLETQDNEVIVIVSKNSHYSTCSTCLALARRPIQEMAQGWRGMPPRTSSSYNLLPSCTRNLKLAQHPLLLQCKKYCNCWCIATDRACKKMKWKKV